MLTIKDKNPLPIAKTAQAENPRMKPFINIAAIRGIIPIIHIAHIIETAIIRILNVVETKIALIMDAPKNALDASPEIPNVEIPAIIPTSIRNAIKPTLKALILYVSLISLILLRLIMP
jgi:hypothetical protein